MPCSAEVSTPAARQRRSASGSERIDLASRQRRGTWLWPAAAASSGAPAIALRKKMLSWAVRVPSGMAQTATKSLPAAASPS